MKCVEGVGIVISKSTEKLLIEMYKYEDKEEVLVKSTYADRHKGYKI
jgi:hypothetical protein